MSPRKQQSNFSLAGFSLVEVLITLTIIGIIAAFTVPKLIQTPESSLGSKQTAKAKDVAFMIINAYEQYRAANGTVPTTITSASLSSYMNYVSVATTGTIDRMPNFMAASNNCTAGTPCLKLHNGGRLLLMNHQFAGSNTTNAISVAFDPDNVISSSNSDSYTKSVEFMLYYDGTIRTTGTLKPGTCNSNNCPLFPIANNDPSWFTGF